MAILEIVVCSLLINRLVRVRMPGGVGEGGLDTRPYPISLIEGSIKLSTYYKSRAIRVFKQKIPICFQRKLKAFRYHR